MPFPARLFRSASFRFAGLLTVCFLAVTLFVAALVHRSIDASLTVQAVERVALARAELTREFNRDGLDELIEAIAPRIERGDRRLHYLVLRGGSETVIGEAALARYVGQATSDAPPAILPAAGDAADLTMVGLRKLDDALTLVVTDDLSGLDEVEAALRGALLNAVAATCLFGIIGGLVLARYLLREVGAITRTAEAIIEGDLSRRLGTGRSADEFEHLRATLDRMLDRISSLLINVQQVSTDIAHDLRTPLTRLRHGLERAHRTVDGREAFRAVIERAIGEIDAVLATFAALLRIAQVEAGGRRAAFRSLDLAEILSTVSEAYEPVAAEGGRSLVSAIAGPAPIEGDRELLIQLFANLVENALTHTPSGTRVTLELAASPDGPVAAVRDDGEGIPAEERPLVTRRFYRAERSRTVPGNGLGLALASAVAGLHGASLTLSDNRPGLAATVHFPRPSERPATPAVTEPLTRPATLPTITSTMQRTTGPILPTGPRGAA